MSASQNRFCPRCGLLVNGDTCPTDGTPTFVNASTGAGRETFGIGQLIGGRYRITNVIGAGGFGAVFGAEHAVTGQAAAVKIMTGDDGALPVESVQRFLQEARITASLNHPNTVRIYDFGQTEGGVLFMAMELLRGHTLEKVIEQAVRAGTALTEAAAANIGVQVLRSLTEAHAAGLVHRDLKPANLILSEIVGEEPVVKVLDFGIARTHNSKLTQDGAALGTPLYMSPEQGRGEVPDGRSDLYALGCILFACVVGHGPFDDSNPMTVMLRHQLDPLPDLRKFARTPISDAFVRIVQKATYKMPADRFESALAMRKALEDLLTSPQPVSPQYVAPLVAAQPAQTSSYAAPAPTAVGPAWTPLAGADSAGSEPTSAPAPANSGQPAAVPSELPQAAKEPPESATVVLPVGPQRAASRSTLAKPSDPPRPLHPAVPTVISPAPDAAAHAAPAVVATPAVAATPAAPAPPTSKAIWAVGLVSLLALGGVGALVFRSQGGATPSTTPSVSAATSTVGAATPMAPAPPVPTAAPAADTPAQAQVSPPEASPSLPSSANGATAVGAAGPVPRAPAAAAVAEAVPATPESAPAGEANAAPNSAGKAKEPAKSGGAADAAKPKPSGEKPAGKAHGTSKTDDFRLN